MTDPQDRHDDPASATPAGVTYDAFLSHNSADKPAVTELAHRLRKAGVEPFLDAWHLVPGEPWQEALEGALDSSRTCVVFVGPAGFGTWENEEMRSALSRRVANPEFRVIPAILPGAVLPDRGRLPRFLSRLTWVDFRPGLDDAAAFDRLLDGIRGVAPDSIDEEIRDEAPIICPFRGLEVFDEEHAEYFFGREALTQYLVEQLRIDRFLAVVGPSGSGKSSVVRAGLVPHLRSGELPGSAGWPMVIVRPGPHPMEALASRLAAALFPGTDVLAARRSILTQLQEDERGLHTVVQTHVPGRGVDDRILIVVDQFEEIFTVCHDVAEREAFVDALLHASSVVGGQTVVVITMRADFFGRCATMTVLAARLAERDVLVPPMEEDDLRRSMIQPAEKSGLQYEKGLVDTILGDLGSEPGSLPLLEHTLLELFEGRRGRWLTIDRYHEIGGVQGAIAQRAETVFAHLTPEQQSAARRVLLRLTQPGEGTEDTRRRASVTELLPTSGSPDAVEAVVDELATARLLVTSETDTGEEIVDVAHEALIRGWPRLQGWISENPAGLRIHRRITETATEWEASKRDQSYLFTGQRLVDAVRWAGENDDDVNDVERDFLAASEAESQREVAARRRRVQLAGIGTAVAMVLVSVAAIVAFGKADEAAKVSVDLDRQLHASTGQLLASEGERLAPDDPMLGLRLELEGMTSARGTPEVAARIRQRVIDQLRTGRTDSLGASVSQVWMTPDARYLIVESDTDSRIWRLADRTVTGQLPGDICHVDAPRGVSVDVAQIWYGAGCNVAGAGTIEVRRLFDGTLLSSGTSEQLFWDSDDPQAEAAVLATGAEQQLIGLDGARVLATGSRVTLLAGASRAVVDRLGAASVVDAADGLPVKDLPGVVSEIIDRQNGAAFLAISPRGTCELRSADDGNPIGNPPVQLPACAKLQMSPDGSVAAVWMGDDRFLPDSVELFDVRTGRRLAQLTGLLRIVFSPIAGATRVVAIGVDGSVRLLETEGASEVATLEGSIQESDLELTQRPDGTVGPPNAKVEFSRDGALLFVRTGTFDSFDVRGATLFSAATGEPVPLPATMDEDGNATAIQDVTFSPDPSSAYLDVNVDGVTHHLLMRSGGSLADLGVGQSIEFLPPPIGLVILETDFFDTMQVRDWKTGQERSPFPDGFGPTYWPRPETEPPIVGITWGTIRPKEDRHPYIVDANGEAMRLTHPDNLVLSPDPRASWFVNGSAVWSRLPVVRSLADLPTSVQETHFDSTGRRLVVGDLSNARGYLVDMDWLARLADVNWTELSDDALIDLVCAGPAGSLVDPNALQSAMQGAPPVACHGTP